ncbi:hypothetical protein C5O19_16065 [Siphonobacter curvatus]|uniref:Uncharacterized protein n=1 Tax=Siphonobacter curvatus TaxID=2094562 RepID=A0A2S7IJS1_9BACT|nr:hypothetical protein C5O19_16065 [Siphonobacter curvatus]
MAGHLVHIANATLFILLRATVLRMKKAAFRDRTGFGFKPSMKAFDYSLITINYQLMKCQKKKTSPPVSNGTTYDSRKAVAQSGLS